MLDRYTFTPRTPSILKSKYSVGLIKNGVLIGLLDSEQEAKEIVWALNITRWLRAIINFFLSRQERAVIERRYKHSTHFLTHIQKNTLILPEKQEEKEESNWDNKKPIEASRKYTGPI